MLLPGQRRHTTSSTLTRTSALLSSRDFRNLLFGTSGCLFSSASGGCYHAPNSPASVKSQAKTKGLGPRPAREERCMAGGDWLRPEMPAEAPGTAWAGTPTRQFELRPLSLGEILDRTFALYRSRFWLFAGISMIAAAVNAVGQAF